MKKSIMVLSVLALAVVGASADLTGFDLSVNFKNNTDGVVTDGTFASYLPAGSLVQLIWAPGDNSVSRLVDGEVGVGGTLKAGEYLLLAHDTAEPTPFGYGSWSAVSGTYKDSQVGDVDIHGGYFFARIFNGAGVADSYYYETTAVAAAPFVFDPADPENQMTYDLSITAADAIADDVAANTIQLDFNGTQVIPEPATIGLMGIAGLGMFLARRKACR